MSERPLSPPSFQQKIVLKGLRVKVVIVAITDLLTPSSLLDTSDRRCGIDQDLASCCWFFW